MQAIAIKPPDPRGQGRNIGKYVNVGCFFTKVSVTVFRIPCIMKNIRIVDKTQFCIVVIGQLYLSANNILTPLIADATQFPNHNAAGYAADLWLETTH